MLLSRRYLSSPVFQNVHEAEELDDLPACLNPCFKCFCVQRNLYCSVGDDIRPKHEQSMWQGSLYHGWIYRFPWSMCAYVMRIWGPQSLAYISAWEQSGWLYSGHCLRGLASNTTSYRLLRQSHGIRFHEMLILKYYCKYDRSLPFHFTNPNWRRNIQQ